MNLFFANSVPADEGVQRVETCRIKRDLDGAASKRGVAERIAQGMYVNRSKAPGGDIRCTLIGTAARILAPTWES